MIKIKPTHLLFFIFLLAVSCKLKPKQTEEEQVATTVERPSFSADSCYHFIQEQIAFGARIPNTPAQAKCALYLKNKLQSYGATTIIQQTNLKIYNGQTVPCYNIIGSYNPSIERRILLCAHWDTRPFMDQEADATIQEQHNDGADDGASGVAVLLEIARQFQTKNPEIGVDIIFFDVEDYGQPQFNYNPNVEDDYCLGTQYWCKNLHVANYKAEAGILLDMVGAKGATFPYEGISMQYAPSFLKQVWHNASLLGYGNYFIKQQSAAITDDHYYINTLTGIPTIDIINRTTATESGFATHWHTQTDNIDIISTATLQAVGETVLYSVYDF